MGNLQQKVVTATQEKLEQLRERSVERAQENFTRLPSYLLEQAFGPKPQTEKKPVQQNHTSFNEEVRAQLGIAFKEQDKPKLDATRSELDALKAQMNFMRKEESEAHEYLERKKEERKNAEMQDDEKRRIEAAQRAQAAAGSDEPGTKASRGQTKRKMPEKTMENKASFGKQ